MEKMDEFFAARVEEYDAHMLQSVEGCREAYEEMAKQVPAACCTLLDLGCGTGLELDAIFTRLPSLKVTGIDLTQAMLDKLKEKHPDKALRLICGSYFTVPLGVEAYDCAVSFQTMHHFSHAAKTALYQKIVQALKPNGIYIECDYMVESQQEEDFYFAENARLRREQGIDSTAFYHYDTPCTVENQIAMLYAAGFSSVKRVFRKGNTTLLIARR